MFRQLVVAALVGVALSAPSKIDGSLASSIHARGTVNIAVSFSGDLERVHTSINSMRFANRGAKITAMMTQLEDIRVSAQRNALNLLESRGIPHTSLWINNKMYVKAATEELIRELAAIPEVTSITEELVIQLEAPIFDNSTINAEWGVAKIEAEAAWSLPGGNNGAGVVVSNIDTGVRYTHTALRNNFRSSYGWYDPESRTASPNDQNGHGTHTMGTIAGSGGIGVAPGAQWIACKGCSNSGCSDSQLSGCGQWVTCPTLANGQSANCNQAPDLVSNSWGGGQGDSFYDSVISAWHTAGIIPLFSQGNSGPSCNTANSPGDSPNVIGVGSTTSTDGISSFSSRGPSRRGGVKPDISAPGSSVRSAWNTGDSAYNTISGTSMACPHAAGATALLLARNRNLSYAQVKNLLQNNADRNLASATACGGTPITTVPNNIYGYGRINARKSLASAINGF